MIEEKIVRSDRLREYIKRYYKGEDVVKLKHIDLSRTIIRLHNFIIMKISSTIKNWEENMAVHVGGQWIDGETSPEIYNKILNGVREYYETLCDEVRQEEENIRICESILDKKYQEDLG